MRLLTLLLLLLTPMLASGADVEVVWDEVTDERIETYRITCNSVVEAEVPYGTHTATLDLTSGEVYTCVATSYSAALGLESAPSNELVIDLKSLPAPRAFKIKITIEVTQ